MNKPEIINKREKKTEMRSTKKKWQNLAIKLVAA